MPCAQSSIPEAEMIPVWMSRFRLTLWKRSVSCRDPLRVLYTGLGLGTKSGEEGEALGMARDLPNRDVKRPTLDQLLDTADSICELLDVATSMH